MKVAVAVLLVCSLAVASATLFSEDEYQFLFTKWAQTHSREYQSYDEFFKRFNVFKKNLDHVHLHSLKNSSHSLAMNRFGDLTNDEFVALYAGMSPRENPYLRSKNVVTLPTASVPASVDWPKKGVVTPVKNQGQCGSCWSFSTTGSVEAAHAIATGNLISLSEQELVDCSGSYGNQGCNGGLMDNAFEFIIANGGLCTEQAYPYQAVDGTCKSSSCTSAVTISSYQDVTPNDEDQLQAAVAKGPVSVAVDAAGLDWQFYSGGVLSDSCGTSLDHGVLAAGYGTDSSSSQAFWLVKNSWGADWGEQGYIRLLRGTGSGNPGECGIAMQPSYPVV